MKGLIVIPAYNEAESIVSTIEELKLWISNNSKDYQFEYLIVDDGSLDDTKKILDYNEYNYVSHCINQGLDGAIKTGILYAIEKKYDFLLQYDGDGQHKPDSILKMVDLLIQGNDIVIGSRFLNCKKPWSMRMLGSRFLATLIYTRTGFKQKIKDPTSGQRMVNKQMLVELSNQSTSSEPAYLSKCINKGYKVKEVQVQMRDRKLGESHFNVVNSIYYIIEQTLSILFEY